MILVTAGLMLVCITYLCRWHLALDEMQQRIQLLSLAWVGPGILLTAIFTEMLRWAGLINPITWNVRAIGIVFLASYCVIVAWFWWKNR
jgi:hypothetical protein